MPTAIQPACAICRDRFSTEMRDCCGRCNRLVCRACSRARGRSHESVLCAECDGIPRPTGFRRTPIYRSWKRLIAS